MSMKKNHQQKFGEPKNTRNKKVKPNQALSTNFQDESESEEDLPTKDQFLFGDPFEDVDIKPKTYEKKDWKDVTSGYLDPKVFIRLQLLEDQYWKSTGTKKLENSKIYSFKCSHELCKALLQISCEMNDTIRDIVWEKKIEGLDSEKYLTRLLDLIHPRIKIQMHSQHSNHNPEASKSTIKSRLETVHPQINKLIKREECWNMKPKKLITKFRDRKIPEEFIPAAKKLGDQLCRLRRKEITKFLANDKTSLEEFLEQHHFEKVLNDEDLVALDYNLNADKFVIVLTTKGLLRNIINQATKSGQPPFINADATYKVLLNSLKYITVGTEDAFHTYLPIVDAIVASEDEWTYTFVLNSLLSTLKKYYDFDFHPKVTMTDAAKSIYNSFSNCFTNYVHALCLFHRKADVKNYIQRFKQEADESDTDSEEDSDGESNDDDDERENIEGEEGSEIGVNESDYEEEEVKESQDLRTPKEILKDSSPKIMYSMDVLHRCLNYKEFSDLWILVKESFFNMNLPQKFIKYFEKCQSLMLKRDLGIEEPLS